MLSVRLIAISVRFPAVAPSSCRNRTIFKMEKKDIKYTILIIRPYYDNTWEKFYNNVILEYFYSKKIKQYIKELEIDNSITSFRVYKGFYLISDLMTKDENIDLMCNYINLSDISPDIK